MIVDSAIYVEGKRLAEPNVEEPSSLREAHETCREQHGVAWIGLYRPTEEEFATVAEEFDLHPLAVEDAVKAHQRPKLERYGETLFVVLRPARYLDESETEEFGGNAGASRRIYELSRVVIEFQRATKPLAGILERLTGGEGSDVDPEVRRYLRDVQDHALQVIDRVDGFRELLSGILSVNLTLVSLAQNEEVKNLTEVSIDQNDEVKKISAWAAILFAPTLVAAMHSGSMPDTA